MIPNSKSIDSCCYYLFVNVCGLVILCIHKFNFASSSRIDWRQSSICYFSSTAKLTIATPTAIFIWIFKVVVKRAAQIIHSQFPIDRCTVIHITWNANLNPYVANWTYISSLNIYLLYDKLKNMVKNMWHALQRIHLILCWNYSTAFYYIIQSILYTNIRHGFRSLRAIWMFNNFGIELIRDKSNGLIHWINNEFWPKQSAQIW